jgi:hypothetical protein
MNNNTTTFKKLSNGTWGIQGRDLRPGDVVTVTKANNGGTKQVVVVEVMPYVTGYGSNVATFVDAPTRVVVAEVTVAVPTGTVTEEGFYLFDGQAYKVIGSRDGSFHYARLVTGHGLKKAPGVFNKLTSAMKMTPEQIAAYGVRTRVCVNCSHTLSDPASQRVGLGTECGPNILGKDAYKVAYKAAKAAAEAAQAKADAETQSATPMLDLLRSQPVEPVDADEAAFRQGWEEAFDEGNRAEAALAEREMSETAALW